MCENLLELRPDTIMSMPIECRAIAMLKDYVDSNHWCFRNWCYRAEKKLDKGTHMDALAEAWSWLEAHCLVAVDYEKTDSRARKITSIGAGALEACSIREIVAAERIGLDLHPLLQGKIRPVFLLGDYETAAFKAMKEVEVRVRYMAGLPDNLIGTKLMREAFKVEGGRLTDPSHEKSEQLARANLFAGAIGSFKNPTSHRPVTYKDPVEASEVVLLADLLMRLLDSIKPSCSTLSSTPAGTT